jgi:hypothetical protein
MTATASASKKPAAKKVTAVWHIVDFEERMQTFYNRALEAMRTFPGTSGDRWHVTSPLGHLAEYLTLYGTVLETYSDNSAGARRRRDNAGKKLEDLYKRTDHWDLFVAYREEPNKAKKLKLYKAYNDAKIADAAARAGMSVRAYRAKSKGDYEARRAAEVAEVEAAQALRKARETVKRTGKVLA